MTATMTAVLALGALAPAAAQGPATMRGLVYDCSTGEPIAGADVRLASSDGLTSISLRSDAHGRFARVGLSPGTYRIEATKPAARHVATARRLARLESDDVLEVRLGTQMTSEGCEPYLVPLAVPTSNRYIIHG